FVSKCLMVVGVEDGNFFPTATIIIPYASPKSIEYIPD
ncbi:heat shock protein 60, partial [Moniliophthora roreri]